MTAFGSTRAAPVPMFLGSSSTKERDRLKPASEEVFGELEGRSPSNKTVSPNKFGRPQGLTSCEVEEPVVRWYASYGEVCRFWPSPAAFVLES